MCLNHIFSGFLFLQLILKNMTESYIKLLRKLLDWEWFNDSEMVHLFIYLLLKANFVKGNFQGNEIERGQLITGIKKLNKDTGISEQSLRTRLKRLKSTGEITIESTNKYSIITIVKYDEYQCYDIKSTVKITNNLTNEQQTTNKQLTTIKEFKEYKEEEYNTILLKKESKYNFRENLISYGFKENLVDEWLIVRKKKKATNSETAFKRFISEIEKSEIPINEILEIIISKSWSGFENEWLNNQKNQNNGNKQTSIDAIRAF